MAPAHGGDKAAIAAKPKGSPIVRALVEAERGTTGEIRVHLSRAWIEKNPFARAEKIFEELGMGRTAQRNGVLLYLNLRHRTMAIVADEGIHRAVGQAYWEGLLRELRDDLHATWYENAVALAVRTLGATMQRYFPAALD